MLTGFAPGTMPAEFVGGLTPRGVANLHAFVSEGGVLVAQDSASELPIDAFGLPVRNRAATLRSHEFYIPGSLLKMKVDDTHPVGWGMPQETAAFFIHSPAFEIGTRRPWEDDPGGSPQVPEGLRVVASYPDRELLMSGWLLGERHLVNKPSVLEATIDQGRVVLLGFRVQHRGQPHATFKLLFNAIYLGGLEGLSAPKATLPATVQR
jgi:hypothetical protein